MVNISKIGDSAIKFTFTNNDHYLYNGEIEVPLNSLILTIDSSDMATFKKIDGDPFVSFLISNSNFESKADLETFYEENMVGEQGGSSSGITSGEVQTMIDESISGKADSSAVTEDIAAAVSGKVDTSTFNTYSGSVETALSGKVDTSAITSSVTSASTDAQVPSAKAVYDALGEGGITSGEVQTMIDESISGITTDVNTISGKVNTNEEVTARALNTLNGELSGKADSSAVTEDINAAVSGKVDTSVFETYSGSVETALSGKVDTSAVTTSITSASTNLEIPTALAVYAATSGGTGGNANIIEVTQAEYDALVSGQTVDPTAMYVITDATEINMSGYVQTSAITSSITSGSTDSQVPSAKCVYDQLGGLKLQQITQADYDALVSGGTVDDNTLYVIVSGDTPTPTPTWVTLQKGDSIPEGSYQNLRISSATTINYGECISIFDGTNYNYIGDYCTETQCTEYDEETGDCLSEDCLTTEQGYGQGVDYDFDPTLSSITPFTFGQDGYWYLNVDFDVEVLGDYTAPFVIEVLPN